MSDAKRTYRWRGISHDGNSHMGQMTLTPEQMAGAVEVKFKCGWRSLLIAEGEGPVPPSPYGQRVAAIEPHPETGRRTWWAETGADVKAAKS